MFAKIEEFRLPTYREIPDVGLYLEQVVKYINSCLEPLGCIEITSSMVSNYVKQKYIDRPVKKQYSREQIAYLMFIAIVKSVLSMDNIFALFAMQKEKYEVETAYDYFRVELEILLQNIFSLQTQDTQNNVELSEDKRMLHSALIASANIIYLNDRFERMKINKKK